MIYTILKTSLIMMLSICFYHYHLQNEIKGNDDNS